MDNYFEKTEFYNKFLMDEMTKEEYNQFIKHAFTWDDQDWDEIEEAIRSFYEKLH